MVILYHIQHNEASFYLIKKDKGYSATRPPDFLRTVKISDRCDSVIKIKLGKSKAM